MVMMMVAAVVPSFPGIMATFSISEQEIGLVITVFTIPLFILGWVGGIMADRIGRKKIFIWSLILFGVFGGACAFTSDFRLLLLWRMLQGIASAPLGGLLPTIISDLFSGNQRNEALGVNNTINYAGYVVFPVIGGALAGISWSSPFLLFLVAVPIGIIAKFYLKSPEPEKTQSLSEYFRGTLYYLKSWKVMWLFLATIITYILLYGAFLTYFTILVENRFSGAPIVLGSFVSVLGLMTAIASFQVGKLSKYLSSEKLVVIGFIIYAVATAIVPLISNIWLCLLPVALFGIGHGLNLPSLMEMASKVTPLEHRAGFMAIQTTMIPLGMTLSAPLIGFFYSVTGSIDMAFYFGGLLALVAPLLAILIRKKKSDSGQN